MARQQTTATRRRARQPREDLRPRLSAHPRARRHIREAKAWAAIVGFVLVGVLATNAGQPLFDAGLRALAAGIGCYVVAWAVAVAIWRHVARAEVMLAGERIAEQGNGPLAERWTASTRSAGMAAPMGRGR